MQKSGASQGPPASELISKRIADLGDWRGDTLSRMRALIKETIPDVVEEWKWMGTPVWSRDGIICTGESYKKVVKLTFAKGAFLKDPARLFNSSLDGNVRRAIDIHEGEEVDKSAFQGARSRSGCTQQLWQVKTCRKSEVLRQLAARGNSQKAPITCVRGSWIKCLTEPRPAHPLQWCRRARERVLPRAATLAIASLLSLKSEL